MKEKNIILNSLKKINEEDIVRLHMPGHKGKNHLSEKFDWFNYDYTEIDGTDNLHNPKDIILKAENNASVTFGSERTYFLVNGTTCGILAAMMASCNPKGKFIVARNSHRSVWSALILGDIVPIYIQPQIDQNTQVAVAISTEDVYNAIKSNPDAEGMILTNPSYYGTCSDVKKIANILHQAGKVLIVDEAHGAHLSFNSKFPISALEANADIVIQSTHKILPSFTQSSMLHVKGDRIDKDKLELFLSMVQSSSPSYPLMISLDMATSYMREVGCERLEEIKSYYDILYNRLKNLTMFNLIGKDRIGNNSVVSFDYSKIWIDVSKSGLKGYQIEKILRDKYKIQIEMSENYSILAMMGTGTERSDIIKLIEALEDINKQIIKKEEIKSSVIKNVDSRSSMSLRQTIYSKKVEINIFDAIGEISADFIIPYPPGIPLLLPGERLSKDIVSFILDIKKNGGKIIGISENYLINVVDKTKKEF